MSCEDCRELVMLESLGAVDESYKGFRGHLVVCAECRCYAIKVREMEELSALPLTAESDQARRNLILASFGRVLDAQLEECEAWREYDVVQSYLIN